MERHGLDERDHVDLALPLERRAHLLDHVVHRRRHLADHRRLEVGGEQLAHAGESLLIPGHRPPHLGLERGPARHPVIVLRRIDEARIGRIARHLRVVAEGAHGIVAVDRDGVHLGDEDEAVVPMELGEIGLGVRGVVEGERMEGCESHWINVLAQRP